MTGIVLQFKDSNDLLYPWEIYSDWRGWKGPEVAAQQVLYRGEAFTDDFSNFLKDRLGL